MKLLSLKKDLRISHDITAMDSRVIARRGTPITPDSVSQLPKLAAREISAVESLGESQHYFNFKALIAEPKYWCVPEFNDRKDRILRIFSSIKVNQLLIKELNWLERYGYHYDHILAVTALVTCMSLELHNDYAEVAQATLCGLTYDIGITRVPEPIFLKLSTLAASEQEVLREHPFYSYLLLSYYGYGAPNLQAQVALEHHEDFSGDGYPFGSAEQHTVARMIRFADMFDALITTRPYRPAQSPTAAVEALAPHEEPEHESWQVYSLLRKLIQSPHVII